MPLTWSHMCGSHSCVNTLPLLRGSQPTFSAPTRQHRHTSRTRITLYAKLPSSIPTKQYFSEVDPKAEIYSRAPKKFSPEKKTARYEPEFIWQTNWQEAMKYEQDLKEQQMQSSSSPPTGGLSLSRVAELDRLDTDLSPTITQPQPTSASNPPAYLSIDMFTDKRGTLNPPIRARGTRFAGTTPLIPSPNSEEMRTAAAIAEQVAYDKLKLEFQIWTFALMAMGFGVSYAFYTKDIAVSYLMGSVGGVLYLRLLNKTVDAMGGSGAGAVAGALSQPRLLIPAVLVLVFSRWNVVAAGPTGVHLQLIPMLLGFFTYKGGMLGRQAWSLMAEISQDVGGPYDGRKRGEEAAEAKIEQQ